MSALSDIGRYRFLLPSLALRPYITTYYFFDIQTPDGKELDDILHPEWASARFMLEGKIDASIIPNPPAFVPPASLTGPTISACHIRCNMARMAGIGVTPLGWHKLMRVNASEYANQVFDVEAMPQFSIFAQIWNDIRDLTRIEELAEVFDSSLIQALRPTEAREKEIEQLHLALTNPDISDVAQLAAHVGMTIQRVERLTRRVFGFPPKKLLRRQRFLRTLGLRLLDPDMRWNNAMDAQYHDQPHFNREFHAFMGMSPSEYLAMPRPISKAAIRARADALGQPLQVLHRPQRDD